MTDLQAAAFHHEAIQAVALWTGLCLILLLVLTYRVSAQRRKHRVSLGDGGHEPVNVAVRAFGNAVEYIPMGLVAITVVAMLGWTAAVIHALGAALFLGRILHAVGMHSAKQPAPGRLFGMVLTYLVFLVSAVLLIVGVFL
ncbi:MAPEG family protein [Brevundimonas sp. VNH65]|uniref:MAPEG family protein n=1 Tax=Brevundimonas sp. VNH65 TaxID=3400917 RepID=UPI003C05FE64